MDIEKKALELVNYTLDHFHPGWAEFDRKHPYGAALCRAIEQHEAFRREVSDAVEQFNERWGSKPMRKQDWENLSRFIIPRPDPLVEAWIEATGNTVGMEPLNAAIAKRGGKIVWGEG